MRRVQFNGFTSLEDYCSKPGYSSGEFIADSRFAGHPVLNGTQQQFLVRSSTLDGWSNAVWNQVFSGDVGDTGVVVNGAQVTAYGLFVEHYEKYEVIWNGKNGTDIFFQNEMPYDPPSQTAWMANPATNGYPAFLITHRADNFHGYGMGSYSFFSKGAPVFATNAFEIANTPGSKLRDVFTVFLSTAGSGGIDHVVDGTGRSSTAVNPDTPVDVVGYP